MQVFLSGIDLKNLLKFICAFLKKISFHIFIFLFHFSFCAFIISIKIEMEFCRMVSIDIADARSMNYMLIYVL